jgi:hypothetical protein
VRVGRVEFDLGQHAVGAPADVGSLGLRHRCRAGIVDVGVVRSSERQGRNRYLLERSTIVARQYIVRAGLVPPQTNHLLERSGFSTATSWHLERSIS